LVAAFNGAVTSGFVKFLNISSASFFSCVETGISAPASI
jgi:hypothetical protein